MGSRSRSTNSSASTTNARQYTATDDAQVGDGNTRSEVNDNSVTTMISDDSVSSYIDESVSSFEDNSDHSFTDNSVVNITDVSDEVATSAILATTAVARDLVFAANLRADVSARDFASQSAERDSQLAQSVADINSGAADFVGSIVTEATETIGSVSKGAADTVATATAENNKILMYGAAGAAALVLAVSVIK